MNLKTILLFATIIPFLINIYIAKYLYDIRKNEHCRNIDSELVKIYYDFYIVSIIILIISIIGILLSFNKYTNIINNKNIKKIINLFMSNNKILEIISILVNLGLIKIVYDLKNEPECKNIDPNMNLNIYYSAIFGLVISVFNILNIDFYKNFI